MVGLNAYTLFITNRIVQEITIKRTIQLPTKLETYLVHPIQEIMKAIKKVKHGWVADIYGISQQVWKSEGLSLHSLIYKYLFCYRE